MVEWALIGKPVGTPTLGWERNVKIDLIEIAWGNTERIDLARDRNQWRALLKTIMTLRVP